MTPNTSKPLIYILERKKRGRELYNSSFAEERDDKGSAIRGKANLLNCMVFVY